MSITVQDFRHSSEFSAKMSEILKERWRDPKFRNKCVKANKRRWKNPTFRKRMAEVASERFRRLWQDPNFRKKIIRKQKRRWKDPKFKAKMSKINSRTAKQRWKNPEFRQKVVTKLSESWKRGRKIDPKRKERARRIISRKSKQLWQDPKFRAKVIKKLKEKWKDPMFREKMLRIISDKETREKISKGTKEALQDPKIRRKIKEANKKHIVELWQNPEHRAQMSMLMKNRWKDPNYVKKFHVSYNTKPEKIVESILNELEIPYEKQKPIFGIPDFFIEPNYCIFVDGDYWHSRPKQIERDREVNEYLTSHGYNVLRFWEHEVYKKREKVRRTLENVKKEVIEKWVLG